ncbi:MAG: ABC transporter ATP-binding protein [Thaumarchaeota archaeon]|nr:ABC transporter ATP-binding protein [Nitrososphaerota archaeon]
MAQFKMTPVLEVEDLRVSFRSRSGGSGLFERSKRVVAVDGVSFSIAEGETFGLVGETGSGKSTIARVLVGLHRPASGTVKLLGEKIDFHRKSDVAKLRRSVGIVFQDPVGSLNSRLKVREVIREALVAGKSIPSAEFEEHVEAMPDMVGLRKSALDSYPKELSGGEKQRVSLARALVVPKKLLILDEPTSSLDVSVQAQVLNTLRRLKSELGLAFLFITHDINVMKYVSDSLGILYYGKLVELGRTRGLVTEPKHPYTQKLMANIISLKRAPKQDSIPDPGPSATGCIYSRACPDVFARCTSRPPMFPVGEDRSAACFLYENP